MRVIVVASIACFVLASCYVPDQAGFDTFVNERVRIGMPMSSAIDALTTSGFTCSRNAPADCSRTRQSVMPYTCIERVRIVADPGAGVVGRLDVPPIACAGL